MIRRWAGLAIVDAFGEVLFVVEDPTKTSVRGVRIVYIPQEPETRDLKTAKTYSIPRFKPVESQVHDFNGPNVRSAR